MGPGSDIININSHSCTDLSMPTLLTLTLTPASNREAGRPLCASFLLPKEAGRLFAQRSTYPGRLGRHIYPRCIPREAREAYIP